MTHLLDLVMLQTLDLRQNPIQVSPHVSGMDGTHIRKYVLTEVHAFVFDVCTYVICMYVC